MNNTLTHEQHLKQVDHQIGVVDRRFERSEFRTNQRFDVVEDRLDRHDNQFLELKGSIDDLAIMTKEEFDRVYERFDRLETLVKKGFERTDRLEDLVKKGFEKTDKLETLVNQGFKRFDNLETLVKKGFERTDKLESLIKKGFGIA